MCSNEKNEKNQQYENKGVLSLKGLLNLPGQPPFLVDVEEPVELKAVAAGNINGRVQFVSDINGLPQVLLGSTSKLSALL